MKNIVSSMLISLVASSVQMQAQNQQELNRQTPFEIFDNDSTRSTSTCVWTEIRLTDPDAKLGQANGSTRLYTALSMTTPLSAPHALNVSFPQLTQTLHAPAVYEKLFEALGGEFIVGEPDVAETSVFALQGAESPMPGMYLGLNLGRRVELRAGVQYFKASWSGDFPITVFRFNHSGPTKQLGAMQAEALGLLTELDAAYFFTGARLQPFIRAGLRAQYTLDRSSKAELAGVPLPLSVDISGTQVSPFSAAGLRLRWGEKVFVEAACTGGCLPERKQALSLAFGGGWLF